MWPFVSLHVLCCVCALCVSLARVCARVCARAPSVVGAPRCFTGAAADYCSRRDVGVPQLTQDDGEVLAAYLTALASSLPQDPAEVKRGRGSCCSRRLWRRDRISASSLPGVANVDGVSRNRSVEVPIVR